MSVPCRRHHGSRRSLLCSRSLKGSLPLTNLSFSLGWGISVTFLRYGAQFFKQRRILQQYLAKTEVPRFRPIHTDEARRMLKNLVHRPADFDWLVRRYVSAAAFKFPRT